MVYKPLVIGGNHHNTYSLLRCFGETGMKVDLILYECKNSYIEHSKYVDQLWYCKNAEDAVEKVRDLFESSNSYYVVLSATDAVASIMDLNYDEFAGKCNFFNAGVSGHLTYYMNKEVQTEEAKEAGLTVPMTKSFAQEERLTFDSFPCIIKPLASINGGKQIAICQNQKELIVHAEEFVDVDRVLVQQFLSKDEEIVLLGAAANGKVVIPGYIIKYRDVMGGTTYSSTAPVEELDEDLVKNAKRMVISMHYDGLFGIEFIKSGSEYYFIEINLRNDATSYSLAVAGVNLPLMYYNACINKNLLESKRNVRKINSMVEIVDFRNVLHRKVGLLRWMKQRRHAECRYFYSKEDPKPYKVARKEFLIYLLGKVCHF